MLKDFTERLRAARSDRTQAEAAKLLGISVARLSNYEVGKREPDLALLKRIVESYGVSADWLLGVDSPRISLSASGGSVAANNSTVHTGGGGGEGAERARLLGIIESQQRVIEVLAGEK